MVDDPEAYRFGKHMGHFIFNGHIYGKDFKSFKYENLTDVIFNFGMFNYFSGLITEESNFNFEFISKNGNLMIVNQKLLNNPVNTQHYELDSFIHRTDKFEFDSIIPSNSLFNTIDFISLNLRIMLNQELVDSEYARSNLVFLTLDEYIKYLWIDFPIESQFDKNAKLMEPLLSTDQGFNCSINFDKQLLASQLTNNYLVLVKQEQYNFNK